MNWPDWDDQGKKVIINMPNGEAIIGILDVNDFFPDENGGEVPMFSVKTEDGCSHSFAGNSNWEFI